MECRGRRTRASGTGAQGLRSRAARLSSSLNRGLNLGAATTPKHRQWHRPVWESVATAARAHSLLIINDSPLCPCLAQLQLAAWGRGWERHQGRGGWHVRGGEGGRGEGGEGAEVRGRSIGRQAVVLAAAAATAVPISAQGRGAQGRGSGSYGQHPSPRKQPPPTHTPPPPRT